MLDYEFLLNRESSQINLPADSEGIVREWLPTVDQTRKQAELVFENVVLEAGQRLWYNPRQPQNVGLAAPVARLLDEMTDPS